jgi:hypothetical protein
MARMLVCCVCLSAVATVGPARWVCRRVGCCGRCGGSVRVVPARVPAHDRVAPPDPTVSS